MSLTSLLSNISKHIELSREDIHLISELFETKSISKNDFLLKESQICSHINFVSEGTLRAYIINEKGKESTIMFAIKDWWITDMYCFLNTLPSMVNIQAIEESTILKISYVGLNLLFNKVPKFNIFFRILMQNAYCREQLRTIQNLTLPAIDRYNNFMIKYDDIAKKVPLKHIASYLGITPEFLSVIRAGKG